MGKDNPFDLVTTHIFIPEGLLAISRRSQRTAGKLIGGDEKRPAEIRCPEGPLEASLTHTRFGYPSAGCVPAEPASVSPNDIKLNDENTLNTRALPEKIPVVLGLAPDYTQLVL